MNEYDIKRLAIILTIQAEIDGMKAANDQYKENQPYTDKDFKDKAEELRIIAYKHNEQL